MNIYSLEDIQNLTLKSTGLWLRTLSSGLVENKKYPFQNKEEVVAWVLNQQEFVLQCVFDFYYKEHTVGLTVKEQILEQSVAQFNHNKTLEQLLSQTHAWEERYKKENEALSDERLEYLLDNFDGFEDFDLSDSTETSGVLAHEEEVVDFIKKACEELMKKAESLCQSLGRVTKQGMELKDLQRTEYTRKGIKP